MAIEQTQDGLSLDELAARAGIERDEALALVHGGIFGEANGEGPFREADVRKVRLVMACVDAGLPLEAIVAAVRSGRLSFAFLELPTFGVWSDHESLTFREAAARGDMPLGLVVATREALGFARPSPDAILRKDDLRVLSLVELALEAEFDESAIARLLRVYGDALNRIAEAEGTAYRTYLQGPLQAAGEDPGRIMQLAAERSEVFIPLLEEMLVAVYHRQQEHVWLQNMVEEVELALEQEGLHRRVERPSALSFVDLTGYTTLTERHGDEAAARLAAELADVVQGTTVQFGGRPIKWLGDGVMSHFPDPSRSVEATLTVIDRLRATDLPAAHAGLAAGPVVQQDGDFFGRTVNLAARLSDRAAPGQVLVDRSVVDVTDGTAVSFESVGPLAVKGFPEPIVVYQASTTAHTPASPDRT